MKILDRHLLREFLLPLFYTLAGFALVYVVIDLFENLERFRSHGVRSADILRYYRDMLPTVLDIVMPVSLLLATLYTLADLTRHNEITAMRACGFSLNRVMVPYLGMGLVAVAATAAVKEWVAPPALERRSAFFIKRAAPDAAAPSGTMRFAYYSSRTRHIWWIDSFDPLQPNRLTGVLVTREEPGPTALREEIRAQRADWLDGAWWFHNSETRRTLPDDVVEERHVWNRPLELRHLKETPRDFLLELKAPGFMSSLELWTHLHTHPNLPEADRALRTATLHQRLAMPWACFVVILFGIPAGTQTGRTGAFTGVLLALGFLLGYYALMNVGLFLSIQQLLPAWAGAWLPNIAFLGIGLTLARHTR
jgi:lipopolysaccharide export system permease protein